MRGQVCDGLYQFSANSSAPSDSNPIVHNPEKMIDTQFGKKIKKFQSDWGGEFRAFTSVLASHGILHRVSCPHTSKQNWVAKRKHRHIVETSLHSWPKLIYLWIIGDMHSTVLFILLIVSLLWF